MAGDIIIEADKVERATDVVRTRVILKSPSGKLFELTVDDNGILTTTEVVQ
jgi:hypothetical protein